MSGHVGSVCTYQKEHYMGVCDLRPFHKRCLATSHPSRRTQKAITRVIVLSVFSTRHALPHRVCVSTPGRHVTCVCVLSVFFTRHVLPHGDCADVPSRQVTCLCVLSVFLTRHVWPHWVCVDSQQNGTERCTCDDVFCTERTVHGKLTDSFPLCIGPN